MWRIVRVRVKEEPGAQEKPLMSPATSEWEMVILEAKVERQTPVSGPHPEDVVYHASSLAGEGDIGVV